MFVDPKEILVSGPLWVTERTNVRLNINASLTKETMKFSFTSFRCILFCKDEKVAVEDFQVLLEPSEQARHLAPAEDSVFRKGFLEFKQTRI